MLLRLSMVFVVVAIPLQRLRGSFPTEDFFHGDIAFLPALFDDVARGGSLSSWGLPEAPYFLPDWPLYFVAWLIAPSYSSAMALFALLQLALFAAVWLALVRYLSTEPLVATVMGLGVFVAAGLAGQVPADYASVSFAHFGTFILALAALVVWFRLHLAPADHPPGDVGSADHGGQRQAVSAGHRQRWLLFGLVLLVVVATASDPIFVAWLVVPVAAIELSAALGSRWGRSRLMPIVGSWPVVGSLVVGTAVGFVLRSVVVRSSGDYTVGVGSGLAFRSRLRLVFDIFFRSELTEFWLLYSLLVLVAAALWYRQWWRQRHNPTMFLFGLWFAGAAVGTVLAEAIVADVGWRYHQFLYHVPVLMLGLWLPDLVRRIRLAPTGLAVVAALSALAWGAFPLGALSIERTPGEVACLDQALAESGSRAGIGNYSASRLAVVQSSHQLAIGSRNSWMAPEEDVHSRAWARDSADFVIFRPTVFGAIPENTVRSLAVTEPVETVCAHWRVLDFGTGGIDLDRLAVAGGRAEVPGCRYGSQLATPSTPGGPRAEVASSVGSVSDPDPDPDLVGGGRGPESVGDEVPGTRRCPLRVTSAQIGAGAGVDGQGGRYVGFGAYYAVEPGRYRLSVVVTRSGEEGPDGVFEVVTWDANRGEQLSLASAPLIGPTIEIEIEVPTSGPEVSLEGRIFYQGGGDLVLEAMVIERLE